MDYKENKIQCFLQTKCLRRCQQFGKFELARCCNSNAAQDKMSMSSYNRDEHRSCQCGERSGPAAEEQLVEDLKTDSWPCLQKSSGKGHLDLLFSLWPKERWVQRGRELRGRAGGWPGTSLPGGPSCACGLLKDVLESYRRGWVTTALQRLRPQVGTTRDLPFSLRERCVHGSAEAASY